MQSPVEPRPDSATFWTLKPLPSDSQQAVAEITQTWNILVKDFGPLDRNISAPHVVESPELRGHNNLDDSGPVAASFPGGVLVNPAALALGIGSDEFLEIVSHSLAHNWFGDQMYPAPDAAVGLGEGLPEYATIVVDEARNGPAARRKRIENTSRNTMKRERARPRSHSASRCSTTRRPSAASLWPKRHSSSWLSRMRAERTRCGAG